MKNYIGKTKIVVSLCDYLNRRLSLTKNVFITNTVYRYSIGASRDIFFQRFIVFLFPLEIDADLVH